MNTDTYTDGANRTFEFFNNLNIEKKKIASTYLGTSKPS